MRELNGTDLRIQVDPNTGYTIGIVDDSGFNWLISDSDWGHVEGFTKYIGFTDNGDSVDSTYKSDRANVLLTLSRFVKQGKYYESYSFKNEGNIDFFMKDGDFGIHFPFQTNVLRKYSCLNTCESEMAENLYEENSEAFLHNTVNAHLWCGEDVAYISAKKIDGDSKWLSVYLNQGCIVDYDIYRDISRNSNGADYRGDLVLLPKPVSIKPGEDYTLVFEINMETDSLEQALQRHQGHISLRADKYTAFLGETIHFAGNYSGKASKVEVKCEGMNIPVMVNGNSFSWLYSSNTCGERTFYVSVDGKKTWIRILYVQPLENILAARALFIAEKQQYNCPGSPLDGAYLIYDRASDSLYCDQDFQDHNAGRERIAMGLTVIAALQRSHNSVLENSLSKYRSFIERELVDVDTGIVYNEVGRNNNCLRIYNFPWFSLFYYELFRLYGNINDLHISLKILIKYYEYGGANQESQCIPFYRFIASAKKCGDNESAEIAQKLLVNHADTIVSHGLLSNSQEIAYVMEQPVCSAYYLSQAWMITGDSKYLDPMEKELKSAESFWIQAPDYHMNYISVRHWDGYWFGKYMQYGDLYPHDWSSLVGEMYYYISQVKSDEKYLSNAYEVLRNNLCLFFEDGSATTGYLYPHKIVMYKSNPESNNPFFSVGTTYGKRFDDWANDQDWALYFASLYLM